MSGGDLLTSLDQACPPQGDYWMKSDPLTAGSFAAIAAEGLWLAPGVGEPRSLFQ